ncbi:MAG: pilus assembly protein [Myxococcaceae bacterium]|nr:pilus assembly protein [Myxococcaceae bacterium]
MPSQRRQSSSVRPRVPATTSPPATHSGDTWATCLIVGFDDHTDTGSVPIGRPHQSGQAAVEAALTLPLTVFLLLGILQLFQLLQARTLAEYAVFRAVRVGSTNHANCRPMMDAALLALLPTFRTFMGRNLGGTPAAQVAEEFRRHGPNAGYRYNDPYAIGSGRTGTMGGNIMLIEKRFTLGTGIGRELEFDTPGEPQRLEVTLTFWYPMRIPFANWVISKMVLGYASVNPMMPTKTANWQGTGLNGFAGDIQARASNGELVMPVQARYSMRMMSPVYDASTSCGGR